MCSAKSVAPGRTAISTHGDLIVAVAVSAPEAYSTSIVAWTHSLDTSEPCLCIALPVTVATDEISPSEEVSFTLRPLCASSCEGDSQPQRETDVRSDSEISRAGQIVRRHETNSEAETHSLGSEI